MKHAPVRRPALFLAALLGLAPLAASQTSPLESSVLPLQVDTGPVQRLAQRAEPGVVASFPVEVTGAAWLRLNFAEVELAGSPEAGNASILRITSMLDGHEQRMNAVHLEQWQNTTAYFNGDAVLVEIVAHPGTGTNRFELETVIVGLPPTVQESQCGSSDDRLPSSDPAVARILPVGCTGWIIDDDCGCMLTAGHCSFGTNVVQFNVPPSTAGGGLVNPPPEDQYVVDQTSKQSNGGQGIGNDYAYFGVFPNTNTNLKPRQAQGTQFQVVNPPAFQTGQVIRITGHGTDFSPPSRNQVQQTHTGPRITAPGTTLEYQVDTTGGNSGSPVILEATGQGIGIHTHAGCSSTGGNHGTSAAHPGLQAFLANPQGVCVAVCSVTAESLPYNGSNVNPPCLSAATDPVTGTNWILEVDSTAYPGAVGTFVQARRGAFPAGVLVGSGELLIDLSTPLIFHSEGGAGGTVAHSIAVPNNLEFVGLQVFVQGGVFGSGLGLCNAIEGVVGCQ